MVCPNCSQSLPANARFCPRCGTSVSPPGAGAAAGEARGRGPQAGADPLHGFDRASGFRFVMWPPPILLIPMVILFLLMGFGGCCVIRF